MSLDLNEDDFRILLSVLSKIPDEGPLDQGCMVMEADGEAVLIGDELAYLQLIRYLVKMVGDYKGLLLDNDLETYESDVDGIGFRFSRDISGLFNSYAGHVDISTSYICDSPQSVGSVAESFKDYEG